MSKLLANQIANYSDNGPVEAKEGLNFPNNKPLQVAGSAGTNGQYLRTTGSGLAWQNFPTIPAAQVNSDWNATSGIAQILNKPLLALVATSGNYLDLSNTPSIPAAQVPSDWTATTGVTRILNKPTLFSGNYNDLINKPFVPSTIKDLADVQLPNTIPNNSYLKWDQAVLRWVPATAGPGSGGISDIIQDVTPQLGGNLDTNTFSITGGSTSTIEVQGQTSKLRFHYDALADLPSATTWHGMFAHVHSTGRAYVAHGGVWEPLAKLTDITADTNTTYTQSAVISGGNVNLRLSGSDNTNDDILVTAGSNVTFGNITGSGFTINAAGGATNLNGLSDVTISSPSNDQILKYNGNQWVNAAPPAGGGGGATNLDSLTDVTIGSGQALAGGDFLQYNSSAAQWQNVSGISTNDLIYAGGGIEIEKLGGGYLNGLISFVNGAGISIGYGANPTGTAGQVITADGNGGIQWSTPAGGGSGGLSSRTTANATTASLANDAAGNITITAAKTYALLKIQTSHAAWVTLYTDSASRTADASRTQNTDPAPGSGVLAEVITTGAQTILMTPTVYGFNNDTAPAATVYLKVVNKSGSAASITVTLTYVQLEA